MRCSTLLDELDEISARHGFDQWAIVASTSAGGLQRATGPSTEAPTQPRSSGLAHTLGGYLAMWKTMDQWVFLTYYTTCQGQLFAAAGERRAGPATFEDSLAIGERTQMRFYDAETLRHLALVQDDPAERLAMLQARPRAALSEQGVACHRAPRRSRPPPRDRRRCPAARRRGAVPRVGQLPALDLARVLVSDAEPRRPVGPEGRSGLKAGPA